MGDFASLSDAACAVLGTPEPADKAARSQYIAETWRRGSIRHIGTALPPARPARPERPVLLPPAQMPRRRAGGAEATRIALLHAIAHIELNAIDLAWDLIARFTGESLPQAFYDDWVGLAAEEAIHFGLVRERLLDYGADYGDLPAHDGLWQAAEVTAGNLLARLAVVPLVLEARGLDVTPGMIRQLKAAGDDDSAMALEIIYRDEIGHVAVGKRWFDYICARDGLDSPVAWRRLVKQHFRGLLKPPFNAEARNSAGFSPDYYENLTA